MEMSRAQIAHAIRTVKLDVRWRPGSAARHLLKRKLRGHLPLDATLADYERIVLAVLGDPHAQMYIYQHHVTPYVAVVAVIERAHWLVTFSLDGLIESAYVVEHPDHYLSKSAFDLVGPLSEVIV